ncbi:ferredoxin-dependent glutamate synthase [Solidesulfovibrio carbinoliphilus subsp. oakridgensis]|uniref:Ferredoxin-dependent glutamate synthase n=1 Tax=Solidesulfovibrio carbinoliphilus subsp. oakridgensis TaxID=694327 RepID=G7Q8P5_9BACT|nr:glutamate synthase-related protein [Solidesulfovibrio carbinoliphilus]EHJ49132.1 ferredoxin-dependent glutamate synthase [Solidesulfovibrio carbinoliphilus subsp. oakridgensis]
MQYGQKTNDVLGTANRGTPVESGLCNLCRVDCAGRCETWLSSLVGRDMLYPREFGKTTAGAANACPAGISYDTLRIQGRLYGAKGLSAALSGDADDCLFHNVGLETAFGNTRKTKIRLPLMTGALGSTFVAAHYWESFAVGCALAGIPIVVGENVVGIDRLAVLENGRVVRAPELDRRIEIYRRYQDDYGAMIVQLNVEDARNGVAEYVIDKYGPDVVIELKWGQGAKNIGGEIKVKDIDYALFLKKRGYLVDPDPERPDVVRAYAKGAIREFARHSRLGYTEATHEGQVREAFMEKVSYLRGLGFERISLKTGAYGMEALAMAIRYASEAGLDLLTIDGAGGGTGMSPWNMMETWGVPSLPLHAKAREYAAALAASGRRVVDISLAGGFAREDHVFKALALGAPFAKLVCMGRAIMIPGFLGSNIEGALYPDRRARVHGHWESLPKSVAALGAGPEQFFAAWHGLRSRLGEEEMGRIPLGAVATCTLLDKLGAGLQQLLAGARKFSVRAIAREDIVAANRETERETGIPYVTDAEDAVARRILLS